MSAPAPAPAQTTQASTGLNDNDVEEWKSRLNVVLADPGTAFNSSSPPDSQSWGNFFFNCLSPPDLCLFTCCLPCVTFGKTHHRLRRNGNLDGYEPINTTCLLFCGSSCVALHCVPMAMQRREIRERYGLKGSCIVDLLTAWWCGCCDLIQADKEVADREASNAGAHKVQYQAEGGMSYSAKQ